MTAALICPYCATLVPQTLCPTCHAQYGFKDGQGKIRSRGGFIRIGILSAVFATICFALAVNIPLWYYYYPLMGFAALLALGVGIVTVMLIRGPKWWPDPNHKGTK